MHGPDPNVHNSSLHSTPAGNVVAVVLVVVFVIVVVVSLVMVVVSVAVDVISAHGVNVSGHVPCLPCSVL